MFFFCKDDCLVGNVNLLKNNKYSMCKKIKRKLCPLILHMNSFSEQSDNLHRYFSKNFMAAI